MKQKLLQSLRLRAMMLVAILCAVFTSSAWATTKVTWVRVTSMQELFEGGTFIMGYEATAKSGVIVPLRSKDCGATTSANGIFNSGTTNSSSTDGTIDMSDLSKVTTSDYEVYITGIKKNSVYTYINIQRTNNTGNYYGATSGGTTSNKARLYTSGNSNETNLTPEWSSQTNNQFKLSANVSGSYKYLKYNTGSPRYCFYNSAGEKVVFYKKVVTHTLTYSATNGGIEGEDAGSNAVKSGDDVAEGATVELSAVPASGYSFTGWSVSGTGASLSSTSTNPTTFTMGTADATVTATFVSASACAEPTFTIDEGTYNKAQSVEIECITDGATIYYTTDGTNPTNESSVYSGAIAVNATTTIKAFAVKVGLTSSSIVSATYTLKCATPTITIPSGVFVSSKVVTITAADGATIRYTTDGSTTPTTSEGTVYDAENKPSISATTTVKAIAYKTGWSDSDVQSTTFTKETVLDGMSVLVAKKNTSDQSYYVNLTDAQVTYVNGKNGYMEDASAGIYIYNISPVLNKVYNGIFQVTYQLYNSMPELKSITAVEGTITDGVTKNPTEMTASDLSTYFADNLGRQIQITGHTTTTTTVLVTGINFYTTYYDPSFEKDHVYTIIGYPYNNNGTKQFRVVSAVEKPDAPTFDPAAGEFGADFELTINAATGSTIYYTTNGDTPTASSTEYNPGSKPTISAGADVTVKAIAVLAGMTSTVGSASYEYKAVSQPTFDPADGTVLIYSETVTLTCDVDGAKIYYTTDGTTPTSSSSEYSDPIAITSDVTLKAIAKKGDDESSVATASYTVRAATPEISVVEGTYDAIQNVTLSCGTIGATIYYTTDGSTPTSSSTAYSSAITVSSTGTTIKAIAIKAGIADSEIASATYTLKAAAPTFSLAGGDFDETQSVELSCATEGAKIYYTINGSTPTASSTLYSSAISVSTITTIKAIAVKSGFTNSDVASQTYSVVIPTSLPFSYNSGYSSIAGTTGLTQSGIDKSDYATTNTKLKFNDTGDYLILKFTGSPNVLSFNIKGNSFSGGTFKVQYSADGSSYTDLKSYTTLGDDSSESFNNIPVSARYIKWVYTSKSSGNVGLGNIKFNGRATVTIAEACTDGEKYYGTYSNGSSFIVPAGVTVSEIAVSGDKLVVTDYEEGDIVPANTGVMISATTSGEKSFVMTTSAGEAKTATNALKASGNLGINAGGMTTAAPDCVYYRLTMHNGTDFGFYWGAEEGAAFSLAANKAYLAVPKALGVKEFFTFDNLATAIHSMRTEESNDAIFNLAGQKMNRLQKGINIVNGKKIFIK